MRPEDKIYASKEDNIKSWLSVIKYQMKSKFKISIEIGIGEWLYMMAYLFVNFRMSRLYKNYI
jgi:hypothetical protein